MLQQSYAQKSDQTKSQQRVGSMSMALDSLDHSMPPISGPGSHSHNQLQLGYRVNGINPSTRKNKKTL